MKIHLIFTILATFFSSYSCADEFEYLQPNQVKEIPKNYASILVNEGCLIPKWIYEFGGVTTGQFAKSGQNDLAVICKNNKGNFIRIFC